MSLELNTFTAPQFSPIVICLEQLKRRLYDIRKATGWLARALLDFENNGSLPMKEYSIFSKNSALRPTAALYLACTENSQPSTLLRHERASCLPRNSHSCWPSMGRDHRKEAAHTRLSLRISRRADATDPRARVGAAFAPACHHIVCRARSGQARS